MFFISRMSKRACAELGLIKLEATGDVSGSAVHIQKALSILLYAHCQRNIGIFYYDI